jgi:predicted transcriptional regulator
VDEAERLISDYLAATSKLSTGEAAKRSGVPKSTIADLRNGKRPNFQPRTLRKIEAFVEQSRPGSSEKTSETNVLASVFHLVYTDPDKVKELVDALMDERIRQIWDRE